MPKTTSPSRTRQSTIKTRLTRSNADRSTEDKSHLRATFLSGDDNKKKKKKEKETRENDKENHKTENKPVSRRLEIHREHMTEKEKMLRDFDLNYNYGPCRGLSRLERWERASSLGLNPPQEIKSLILESDNEKDNECLFEDYVLV